MAVAFPGVPVPGGSQPGLPSSQSQEAVWLACGGAPASPGTPEQAETEIRAIPNKRAQEIRRMATSEDLTSVIAVVGSYDSGA
jgi:hypothetical protein